MKQVIASASLFAVLASVAVASAAERQYQKGQILEVEKKAHTRVLYYIVNTPVTQDDPYYDLSLQLGPQVYRAEYTPRHAADSLPDTWKAGTEVEMRLTGRRSLTVKGPEGVEVQLVVTKRMPAKE